MAAGVRRRSLPLIAMHACRNFTTAYIMGSSLLYLSLALAILAQAVSFSRLPSACPAKPAVAALAQGPAAADPAFPVTRSKPLLASLP
jgi:hypothetical protein